MRRDSKIYVAGHLGLVGSAIHRRLQGEGFTNLLTRTHAELDLERQEAVEAFFRREGPDYVFLAAARVGGIWANEAFPAEFIYNNLAIQSNVIHAAWKAGVRRLLFMGSSCVYPRECPQPMREGHLLTGPLEPTNQPYAVAKISGIIQCEAYNRQYNTRFLAVMPTNLYGPNDHFDLETSHVLPALIRKFHLAKLAAQGDWEGIQRDENHYGKIPDEFRAHLMAISRSAGHGARIPDHGSMLAADAAPQVPLWGTGTPRREFLHVDDLAEACVFLMTLGEGAFTDLCVSSCALPLINVGCGEDHTIAELAHMVAGIVGFERDIVFDPSKPDGTPRKLLEVSRLKGLGWSPSISLEDGIRRTYDGYWSALT